VYPIRREGTFQYRPRCSVPVRAWVAAFARSLDGTQMAMVLSQALTILPWFTLVSSRSKSRA
jgi:hypothetical protein